MSIHLNSVIRSIERQKYPLLAVNATHELSSSLEASCGAGGLRSNSDFHVTASDGGSLKAQVTT